MILLLFSSLDTDIMTINFPNPSLKQYNDLQRSYSDTLECPCSTMTIQYEKFTYFSPSFHQICSSDFVTDRWISILKQSVTTQDRFDWRNQAFIHFQLLSNLCQSATTTVDDYVHRFLIESFVTSDVLTEEEFNTRLNVTLDQFLRSSIDDFNLIINTVELLTQVDQPYPGSSQSFSAWTISGLGISIIENNATNQSILQVCFTKII
jgi:hypothetical protein